MYKYKCMFWFRQFMYFMWEDKWPRRHCKPVISPLMLFVPSKPLNRNQYPCLKKNWWFFFIIIIFSFFTYLGSIFIPIIWTSPKNSSLTSWESLSMYLTKVANSALSEKSIVSSAILLKSVVVIKRDKSPTSRWSLLQVRHPSAEFLEMFVAHLLLNVSAPEYPRHLSPYNRQHLQSSL